MSYGVITTLGDVRTQFSMQSKSQPRIKFASFFFSVLAFKNISESIHYTEQKKSNMERFLYEPGFRRKPNSFHTQKKRQAPKWFIRHFWFKGRQRTHYPSDPEFISQHSRYSGIFERPECRERNYR